MCNIEKPLNEMQDYKNKKGLLGYLYKCKICYAEQRKRRIVKNSKELSDVYIKQRIKVTKSKLTVEQYRQKMLLDRSHITPEGLKICKGCNVAKSFEAFPIRKRFCKKCLNEMKSKRIKEERKTLSEFYLKTLLYSKHFKNSTVEELRESLIVRNKIIESNGSLLKCVDCKKIVEREKNLKYQCRCRQCRLIYGKHRREQNSEGNKKSKVKYRIKTSKELADSYMKTVLKDELKKYKIKFEELPKEYIELRKTSIKLYREVRRLKKNDCANNGILYDNKDEALAS